MTKNNSVVAIHPSHTAAETAIKELQQSGFDMRKLSIVGCDNHTDEPVVRRGDSPQQRNPRTHEAGNIRAPSVSAPEIGGAGTKETIDGDN